MAEKNKWSKALEKEKEKRKGLSKEIDEMKKAMEEEKEKQDKRIESVINEMELLKNKIAELQIDKEIWAMQEKKEEKDENKEMKNEMKKEKLKNEMSKWDKIEKDMEEERRIRCKQVVLITKGRKWNEEINVGAWLKELIGEGDWWWGDAGNSGCRVKVFLESKEQKEKVMMKRKEVREKEIAIIDDWLNREEQRRRTLMHLEADRRIKIAREANIPCVVVKEDRKVVFNGVNLIWKDEKLQEE